jgi:hypothetical protein
MHPKAVNTTERRATTFHAAQAAARRARHAARVEPGPDSVRVSITADDGAGPVRVAVAVVADQLAAFVASLVADPTVLRFTVGDVVAARQAD